MRGTWRHSSVVLAWIVLTAAPVAIADERLAAVAAPLVSPSDAGRVFVSGAGGTFEKVREAVAKAKQETGRDYRVFVLGTAGTDPDAAERALDTILDRWRASEAAGFDPSNDITILLDVGGRSIAYRAPWGLEVVAGLDKDTIKKQLIERVFVPKAKDGLYDEGLADLVTATEGWVKHRKDRDIARAEAARVFRTRTLPIGAAAAGGFGGIALFFLQRARHDRAMQAARKKLESFKGEVVALSDLLDSQQERHRMLPHADPDFKTPMEGLTRVAYDGVQQSVRTYRERWLSLMDIWEKAQAQIDAEWFLGTASAEKALAMLDAADARPPLDEVAAACRLPLDTLESAHEKAREAASRLEAAISSAKERAAAIAKRGRAAAVFQQPLAAADRALGIARAELESDPVAAGGRLDESEASLAEMVGRVDRLEGIDARSTRAAEEAERITRKVAARRAEGWLLSEPGADPDEPLSQARSQLETAAGLLDAGELDSAERHVVRGEQLVAEADAVLESVIAAKARVEELLPGCETRLDSLRSRHGQAERAFEHLAVEFAEASWSDVAENIGKASEGLNRARELVVAARQATTPNLQHYFRGVALAEEAVRQADWVDGCYTAVTDRRAELDELRGSLPARTETVARKAAELLAGLERQRTDRLRANERAREARELVRVAAESFSRPRPDLREVTAMVDAADQTVDRARELAEEDERLARQAINEIEETENQIRRIASWYEEGVSADVHAASGMSEQAKGLLGRQRYEEAIKLAAEAAVQARHAYAAATAEAARRRQQRLAEIQRRQLEESFARMSRGAGPWVIQLPGGRFAGPDPWRSLRVPGLGAGGGPGSRTSSSSWSNDTVQVRW